MHVPSNRHGRLRRRLRSSLLAVSLFATLSLGGAAQAAPFDENLKAPVLRSATELRSQSEPFVAQYRALLESDPEQLVRDAALSRQKFDYRWQLLRAVENRRSIDDPASLGLVPQENGSYRIDLSEHPEWDSLHETIAGVLSTANLDATAPALIARGFRPEDMAILKDYVAANDPDRQARVEAHQILLDFGRVVRKYDKIKRPVPDALVESFYYQKTRAFNESNRRWAEGLLQKLDAQRRRVLMSTFTEGGSFSIWAPSDFAAARGELLAEVRKPDFEARVKAEAKGVAP